MTDLAGRNKTFFFVAAGQNSDPYAPYTNSGAAAALTLYEINAAGVVEEAAGAVQDGSGALSLTLAGVGRFVFNGADSFSGGVDIAGATRVSVGANGALGSGEITFLAGASAPALESLAANFTTAQTLNVETGVSATLEAAADDSLTATGTLDAEGGAGSVLHVGSATDSGTVILGVSAVDDDPAGGLSVDGGTLRIGSAAAASLVSALTGGVTVNGTLDLHGRALTLSTLSGAGYIIDSGAAATLTLVADFTTFSGRISGALALDVTAGGASGYVALTGPHTYTGGTTVETGAELDVGGGPLVGAIVDNGLLKFNNPGTVALAGALSGSGSMQFVGGDVTLSGDSSQFSGSVSVTSGVLTLAQAGALSHANYVSLDGPSTLEATTDVAVSGFLTLGGSQDDAITLEAASGATLDVEGALGVRAPMIVHFGSADDEGVVVLASLNYLYFDYEARGFEIDGGTLEVQNTLTPTITFGGSTGKLVLDGTSASVSSTPGATGEVDLNGARVNVSGGGATVKFVSGPGNVAQFSASGSDWETVDGSGGSVTLTGASASILGGGDTVQFQGSGGAVSLYDTDDNWDTVYSGGTVSLTDAQASVFDGGATVYLLGQAPDAVSLYYTGGVWDTVYGANGAVSLTGAQASVFGGGDTVYLLGAATASTVSLYDTDGAWDTVNGSNALVSLTNAQASIFGGSDTVYLLGSARDSVSLYDTNYSWDTINGSNGLVILNAAQASVFGGGDAIQLEGTAGDIVSLYGTNGSQDTVEAINGAAILNNAQAAIVGYDDTVVMIGGSMASETLTGGGAGDFYIYQQAIGVSTINGFTTHDSMQLSKADFASTQALFSHMSQVGDDTVIRLDADDQITLTGVQKASLSASQFSLV